MRRNNVIWRIGRGCVERKAKHTLQFPNDLDGLPQRMSSAKRPGPGEYVFDLARVNHILGGPDYSTANGACGAH